MIKKRSTRALNIIEKQLFKLELIIINYQKLIIKIN